MSLLEWRDEFRIGIPEVDQEHRELIASINALEADAGTTPEAVAGFLGELHARIAAHFALEEKVMRARRYPKYREHKDDHERLLDEIREIMDTYESVQNYDQAMLSSTLRLWFGRHFRTLDAELHAALHGPG